MRNLVLIVFLFLGFITYDSLRYVDKSAYYEAVGNSMYPAIQDKDIVIASKDYELQVGDIIVFMHHDKKICHRIIRIQSGYIYTKGDNNPNGDVLILTPEDVIGIATAIIRRL